MLKVSLRLEEKYHELKTRWISWNIVTKKEVIPKEKKGQLEKGWT